ncbi:putative fimbrial protein [Escherichia coli]|uniref:Putative fimbrial protein n=1 Tax=Escherichia coli TaxID=562 RepID=A0A3S4NU45_ECOLX|nr:putative fimbrial protein [Escherichia coli]
MKSAFRYFLFLWIITASINNVNAENLTFMVGDDAGVGNLNGPSGDKLISFSYPVGGVNNIVFYNPTSTTPTNAKINYIGVNWTHQVAVGLYIVLQK